MFISIFDVGNASCNYICSPNKYAMMIDCGSSTEKPNPVDLIKNFNRSSCELVRSRPYVTSKGSSYPLALLHVTHPDDDHVRNSGRVYNELTPYLLCRNYTEKYDDSASINKDYVKSLE